MSAHVDVASYALGVLDDDDGLEFEQHLAECDACAEELESLLPVVDLLPDVDVAILTRGPALAPVGGPLHAARSAGTGVPGSHRLRGGALARRAPVARLAAAAVFMAALAGGGVVAAGYGFGTGRETAVRPTDGSAAGTVGTGPRATPDGGLNPIDGTVGGPGEELPPAERLSATDPTSGVRADAELQSTPFGTQVSFAVSRVRGPLVCRLVAVRTTGEFEVLSTWNVPAPGYGTAEQPRALRLQAATALPRANITSLQVQAVDRAGRARPLVTLA